MRRDLAAETMTHDHWIFECERVDHAVKVVDELRDRIVAGAVAIAMSAQLRQHHIPSPRQRFRDDEQARRDVANAMDEDERRIVRIADSQYVQFGIRRLDAVSDGFVRHGAALVSRAPRYEHPVKALAIRRFLPKPVRHLLFGGAMDAIEMT